MGHKTVIFTNETEQRTYVQGEFTGKYRGVLNHENWRPNFEFYNIHIYQGEINNLKNEIENPEIINETIYNAILSETQLTQKSFENVLVNLNYTIEDYDSFRLAIKDPKLEFVQICDVVKDGNLTFGTLTCFVSGYISKASIETSAIEVETCDQCGQFLEECTCSDSKSSNISIAEDPVLTPDIEESFWSKNFSSWTNSNENWGWDVLDNSGFGCLGLLGILIGILVLISFGLPGILVGAFILLIYAIIGPLTRSFPNLTRGFRWFLYTLIGLLLLGWLFHALGRNNQINMSSIPQQSNKVPKTQKASGIKKFPNSSPVNSKSQNEQENTSAEQNTTFGTDVITIRSQENSESQNASSNNLPQLYSQFPSEEVNNSNEKSVESQTEEINSSLENVLEYQNDEPNNANQMSSESQTQASERRQKIEKTVEIMSGIDFHEGEVYICNGNSSKRYHFNPSCPGLSNCSTRIYQINIPTAKRKGRTLCKREE